MDVSLFQRYRDSVVENCSRVIVGKEDVIALVTTAFICSGHVLPEDVPGTGKTMLLCAFAKTVGGEFRRIQFTPDLLPSDLTGINFYNQKLGEFQFRPGPQEMGVLSRPPAAALADALVRTVTPEDTARVRGEFHQVRVSRPVLEYIMDIIEGTREESPSVTGVSTRGAIALYKAAQVTAAFAGREYGGRATKEDAAAARELLGRLKRR